MEEARGERSGGGGEMTQDKARGRQTMLGRRAGRPGRGEGDPDGLVKRNIPWKI